MDDRATEEWNRLARALCDLAEVFKEERDELRRDHADTLADLDTARSEVARLTAEVEGMRGAVNVAEIALGEARMYLNNDETRELVREALDALRARKVGGVMNVDDFMATLNRMKDMQRKRDLRAFRDDLIRLVVGVQWVDACMAFHLLTSAMSSFGFSDVVVTMDQELVDELRPAVDIVDEWLGVR